MHVALAILLGLLALLAVALVVGTTVAARANRESGVAGEYTTTVSIEAAPDIVWRVLTDAPAYANWNPELVAMAGSFGEGAKITASVRLGSGAVRSVPLIVTGYSPPRQMVWTGGMPLGLFVGRRTLSLAPRDNGTDFRMDLSMTGPLAPLILRSVGNRQPEIDNFSAALKGRAESTR